MVIAVAFVGIFVVGVVVRLLVRQASPATVYVNAAPPAFPGAPQVQIRVPASRLPIGPRMGTGNPAFGAQQDAMNRMNQQMEQQRQWAQQMQQQNLQRMQQMQNQSQQNMQAMRERSQQNMQGMQERSQQLQERTEENVQGAQDNSQQSMQRIRGMMRPGPGYGGLGF